MQFRLIKWVNGSLALAFLAGGYGLAAVDLNAAPKIPAASAAKGVAAEHRAHPEFVEVFGTIAQEPENVSDIFAPQAGVVKSLFVEQNQSIDVQTSLLQVETKEGREIKIVSDRRGIIVGQYVQEGTRVDPMTSLMTVADMDHLRGSFDIHEREIGKVKLGQDVMVESLAYPGKVFKGKVVFLSPQVDEETKSMKVRVDIDNAAHELRFGMFVDGKILVRAQKYEEFIAESTPSSESLSPEVEHVPEAVLKNAHALKLTIPPDNTGVIQTEKVKRGRLKIYLEVLGVTASGTERTLKVFPGRTGVLQQVFVAPGDVLTLGQPVLRYQPDGNLSPRMIKAPRPGVVVSIETKAGEPVSHRLPLMTFSDTGNLSCIFDVYEPDIGQIRSGQKVMISSAAFPEMTFQGSIVSISSRVDQNSKSVKVRVQTGNPQGKLKFGMFLTGLILVDERDALLIPVMAVHKIQDRPVVFVSVDGQNFLPREVRLGGQSDGKMEILDGLKEGEILISHGGLLVKAEMHYLEERHA